MYSRSDGSSDGGKKRPLGQEASAPRREKPKKDAPVGASGQRPPASKGEKRSKRQPSPPPAQQQSKGGPLSRLGQMLEGIDSQDLLLIGLIFLLALEGADDDILFILIALLFISS